MSDTLYAIFYEKTSPGVLDRSEPKAAITTKDGVVTIIGDEDFVDRYTRYFHGNGWRDHVDIAGDEALISLFGRMSYALADVLTETEGAPELAKVKKLKGIQTAVVKT